MKPQAALQAAIDRAVAKDSPRPKIAPAATPLFVQVPGIPLPKGSPAILRNRTTGKPFTRESPACVGWQEVVHQVAKAAAHRSGFRPLDGPVRVDLFFVLPRKRSAAKSATSAELAAVKPDADKLARAVLDALEGVAYTTDSRVTRLVCTKRVGVRPGVSILVEADHDLIEVPA